MSHALRAIAALLVVFVSCSRVDAEPSAWCVAMPMPGLRGAEGNAVELATALRDLVSTYLTGPSLRAVALDARLAALALEEARQKDCAHLLTITLTRKKSGGGAFGRALGDAAGAAAWHMPYGRNAATTAARSAAMAGSAAVSSLAANTRAKDEWQLEYRLTSGPTAVRDGQEAAKARTDGEDLVTPLVERMATIIVATLKDNQ